ncbi:hypothetical protein K502DRAFT_350361 [Neoconidiobolus thromboides FSU 785]|nr:hypothetical protein K502DRAFT_350361 [Neoconidiobolus thromboides FSU 785]
MEQGSTLLSDDLMQKSIAALVNGRGLGNLVGLAIFDLKTIICTFFQVNYFVAIIITFCLFIVEFIDTTSFPRVIQILTAYKVEQILIPLKSEVKNEIVYEIVKANLPNIELIPIQRKYFNEEIGFNYINNYALIEDKSILLPYLVTDFYYGICCVGCIFYYFEFDQKIIFPFNQLHFQYKKCQNIMLINSNTLQNLEIIKNLQTSNSKQTLLNVIDNTNTAMGHRLLRLSICQPYTDLNSINHRLNCITELRQKENKLELIKNILNQIPDIDLIASMIIKIDSTISIKVFERNIQCIILTKRMCQQLNDLTSIINDLTNPIFISIYKLISHEKVNEIMDYLNKYINEDININSDKFNSKNIKCFIIKPGLNGLLDVARKAYVETSEDIIELVKKYEGKNKIPTTNIILINIKEEYNLSFKIKPASIYGFELTLNSEEIEGKELPAIFVKIKRKGNVFHLKTLDLIKLNDRHKDAQDEIFLMSKEIVFQMIVYLQSELGFIHKLSESIAILDMLLSNTITSIQNNYVKPEFSDNLILKQAKHPILHSILDKKCVPNNTYSDTLKRLVFVVGPNMSGKTTYLKTIALIVIMAQSGSYIPADYGSIKIIEYLHSRFSSKSDNIGINSSFYKELNETASILNDVDKNSLILFDEFGRGTSHADGIALSYAICEYLINSNCLTLFSTHFQELPNYMKLYPSVTILYMKVQEQMKNGKFVLKYDHYAQEESVNIDNYGIKLASQLDLPEELIDNAYKISSQINKIIYNNQEKIIEEKEYLNQNTIIELGQLLIHTANESNLEPKELINFINSLKQKYINKAFK